MGKWSGLRKIAEKAPVDGNFQDKVNLASHDYLDFSKTDKGIAFCDLRDEKDALEDQISKLNVKLEALSQLLVKDMESDGTDLFRLSDGNTLSIKDEPYVSVQDRPVFIGWVRSSGNEDILTVNYMTMSSMTKKMLEQGLNAPPGLKVFIKTSITRRRAKEN